ncbi:ubiquitin-conjugating enzyme domain-containing protein [Ditylenchus destructor]|uniref:Ubiquitin-conjugating enzyme domain-containing protein n=1 Tax=Ditylenchus destructor TaxID=166010 RepID=A0AAD4MUJ2_9BILA|nr:ubiquitin-conjugating enzyme domain-containing protein [Ditylenchus destructor]
MKAKDVAGQQNSGESSSDEFEVISNDPGTEDVRSEIASNIDFGESGDESLLEDGGHSIQSLETLKSIASLPQDKTEKLDTLGSSQEDINTWLSKSQMSQQPLTTSSPIASASAAIPQDLSFEDKIETVYKHAEKKDRIAKQQLEEQRQQQLMARIRALEEELAAEKQSKASAPLLSSSPVSEPPVRQIVEIHLKWDEQTAQVQVAQPKLEKGETSKTVRKLSLEEEVHRMETALLCKDVADRAKIIQEETLVALLEAKKHHEELLRRIQQGLPNKQPNEQHQEQLMTRNRELEEFPIVQAELPTASKTVRKPSIEEEVVDRMETALRCKDVSVADRAIIMQLIQEESLEAERVPKEQKVLRRIQQEWEPIQRDGWPESFGGSPSETDLFHWQIILVGPAGTPYEDEVYTLSCTFPTDYPDSPPNVCFTTPIQHPNVDRDGNVGLQILQSKWTSDITVVKVLQSIYEFIVEPDLDNAVNQDIAEAYKINRDLHHMNAIDWKQFCNRFK